MRSSHAFALFLLLAAVASCTAQIDVEGILGSLNLDDDDADGLGTISSPEVSAYLDSISPAVAQQYQNALAPYGIDINAPAPSIEAAAEKLNEDQVVSLLQSLLNVFTSTGTTSSTGRKLKM